MTIADGPGQNEAAFGREQPVHGRASRNFSLDSQDWADYARGATGYVVFFSIGTYRLHIFIYSHFLPDFFLYILFILFYYFFFLFIFSSIVLVFFSTFFFVFVSSSFSILLVCFVCCRTGTDLLHGCNCFYLLIFLFVYFLVNFLHFANESILSAVIRSFLFIYFSLCLLFAEICH